MWLKKELRDIKKFLSNYWVDELPYRLLVILDFTILGIVLFAYSYLVGDVININLSKPPAELKGSDKTDWMNNRTLILSLKAISISILISVFTFTITNTIPTVYENYKLDIKKTINKKVVETNRRKLAVVGNFINTVVLISIVIGLAIDSETRSIFIGIILIIISFGVAVAGGTVWIYRKRKETKQAQENQKNNEQEKPPK